MKISFRFLVVSAAIASLFLFQSAFAKGSSPESPLPGPYTAITANDGVHLPLITHIKIRGYEYPVMFTKKGELIALGNMWVRLDALYVYDEYLDPYKPYLDTAALGGHMRNAKVSDHKTGKLLARFYLFTFADGRQFVLEKGNKAALELVQAYFIEEMTRKQISDPEDPNLVPTLEDVLTKLGMEIDRKVAIN